MSVVKSLSRKYDDFQIQIENLELLDHGFTVFWGPSGAGKSSVLRILLGLDQDAHLQWIWEGQDLGKYAPQDRNLGVVFQDLGLFPNLTVQDNILFPVNKKKHINWQKDYNWLVEALELGGRQKSSVHQLSGGEKQRVALARALIYRPKMLLLDEPFSSLDEDLREKSQKLLKQVSAHLDCPVLLVTHDRQDVENLADRVCQMQNGRVVQVAKSLSPQT